LGSPIKRENYDKKKIMIVHDAALFIVSRLYVMAVTMIRLKCEAIDGSRKFDKTGDISIDFS